MEERASLLLGHLRATGTDQVIVSELSAIVRQLADTNTALRLAITDQRATIANLIELVEMAKASARETQAAYDRVPCVRFANWLSRIFRRKW